MTKQINMETWKKIEGYKDWYEASNTGLIRTHNWKGSGKTVVMKPAKDKKGYLRTVLKKKDGKNHTVKVHRIIAQTFIQNPFNKPQVNHKDGVKTNNSVINLEWMTNKENHHHALKNGLISDVFLTKQKESVPECFKQNWKNETI